MGKAFLYRFYPTPEQESLCGRWFVSLLVDVKINRFPKVNKAIGLDMRITSLIATSDAEKVNNPKQFKKLWHKLRTQLVRENQTVVVEDLAIKNMVKNHKLAGSIRDASWGELVRQLTHKCEWYGRELIKIDRWFPSSKRCGNCGHIVNKMPLNVRKWECPKCGTNHDS